MIELNLLPDELKSKKKQSSLELKPLLYLAPLVFGVLIAAHIYALGVFFVKNNQLSALEKKWELLAPQRRQLETLKKEIELSSQNTKTVETISSQRVNWAQKLNRLSLDLPGGVWFTEIYSNKKDFSLKGSVVSLQKTEMDIINNFLNTLKGDTGFFSDFVNLELGSVQRKVVGSYDVVDFIISGKLK